jgi:hypothetical protein
MATFKKIALLFILITSFSSYSYSQTYFEVKQLPFNTKSKELAPAFYKNGLVFCSDRKDKLLMTYVDINNNPLTNLYRVTQKKPGKFDNPELLSKELTTLFFEGPATFSEDNKTIYFTRTNNVSSNLRSRQHEDTTFGIFRAELVAGQWSKITPLEFNRPEYNTGYPCLSDNGKLLFFCSDNPEGEGGFDIYFSKLQDSSWSQPVNLGENVNTSKNEIFPFLHPSGRLYFASRGHKQGSDLDLYYTVNINGIWQKPVPLSEPFNSSSDDYGLIMNATMDTGYYVSDRTGSHDIYSAYSTLPAFTGCKSQEENDYCYVFYEPNKSEVDTNMFTFEWDLGDGTKVRALEAEHCFAGPGTYLVQLNVVDKITKEVAFNQASNSFVVEKIKQPYIQVSDTVKVAEEFSLNGNETYLPDFKIDGYYWDFGDGYRAVGPEIKYKFAYPGIYSLQLGVTDHSNVTNNIPQRACVTRTIVVLSSVK